MATTTQRLVFQRKKILLVENDPMTATKVSDVLRAMGAQVFVCATFHQAMAVIEGFEGSHLHAAIIDYHLPHQQFGNHVALAMLAHRNPIVRAIPRVAYTGVDLHHVLDGVSPDLAQTLYAAIVSKGDGVQSLVQTLQRVCGRVTY